MAVARTIFPSPVFGLLANICKWCPQYAHKIIFRKKCYNEAQCDIPIYIYKMKTRAGKAGTMAVATDASRQVGYVGSVPTLRLGQPTSSIQRAPAPDSHIPVLIHRMKTAETAATLSPTLCQNAQDFPQVLDRSIPPRRPAPNLFKRFLSWVWSKSAYNDPTREMTSSGWRRKQ